MNDERDLSETGTPEDAGVEPDQPDADPEDSGQGAFDDEEA